MILGPKDEAQSPSKARNEERTQRNVELDEFSINQGTGGTDTIKNQQVSALDSANIVQVGEAD